MKYFLVKLLCFITGADWRTFYPEKWDLSKVHVFKEYGGNSGFVNFYNDHRNYRLFSNGIYIDFYDDSLVVRYIVGYTHSSVRSMAVNRRALLPTK
jgi:hypothetical protein